MGTVTSKVMVGAVVEVRVGNGVLGKVVEETGVVHMSPWRFMGVPRFSLAREVMIVSRAVMARRKWVFRPPVERYS